MQAPAGPEKDPSGSFVHGGWLVPYADAGLGRFMIEDDLVNEYHLLFFPVVLGSGKRLFSTGVVMSTYQRAGRPGNGSFALKH
jgi:hypothetical protein